MSEAERAGPPMRSVISPGPSQRNGHRSRTPSDGYGGIPETEPRFWYAYVFPEKTEE